MRGEYLPPVLLPLMPRLGRHAHRRIRRAVLIVSPAPLHKFEEEAVLEGMGVGVAEGAAAGRAPVEQQVVAPQVRQDVVKLLPIGVAHRKRSPQFLAAVTTAVPIHSRGEPYRQRER